MLVRVRVLHRGIAVQVVKVIVKGESPTAGGRRLQADDLGGSFRETQVVLAELGKGSFFGEMALVLREARAAGIVATTFCDVQVGELHSCTDCTAAFTILPLSSYSCSTTVIIQMRLVT